MATACDYVAYGRVTRVSIYEHCHCALATWALRGETLAAPGAAVRSRSPPTVPVKGPAGRRRSAAMPMAGERSWPWAWRRRACSIRICSGTLFPPTLRESRLNLKRRKFFLWPRRNGYVHGYYSTFEVRAPPRSGPTCLFVAGWASRPTLQAASRRARMRGAAARRGGTPPLLVGGSSRERPGASCGARRAAPPVRRRRRQGPGRLARNARPDGS